MTSPTLYKYQSIIERHLFAIGKGCARNSFEVGETTNLTKGKHTLRIIRTESGFKALVFIRKPHQFTPCQEFPYTKPPRNTKRKGVYAVQESQQKLAREILTFFQQNANF